MSRSFTGRLRQVVELVRLQPFDTSTEEGRASERYRRASLTALTGALSRATTIVAALVVVPLCVGHLGNERYGMWLTLGSLFTFAYMADLGITGGLQLVLAGADARDERDEARRYVSSAFAILLKTTTVGALILAALYFLVDWASAFNVTSPAAVDEAGMAAVVFGGVWLFNTFAAVIMRVHYGFQRGYVTHLWQLLGSVMSVAAVVGAIELDLGTPALIVAVAGVPSLAMLLNGIQLFGWRMPWLRPAARYVDRQASRRLLRDGSWYLLAGLGYNAVYLSCNMLVAQWLGADAVPEFGVPYRVAAVLTLVCAVIVNSFLPAFAEAAARGDRAWVRRALIRSLTLATIVGAVGAVGYVVLGKWVIAKWVGDAVHPSYTMLSGLAAWALVSGFANGINSFVQGTGGVRANGLQWVAAAVLAVPTQLLFISRLGVDGVPWALVVTEALCRLVPGFLYYRAWLADAPKSRS